MDDFIESTQRKNRYKGLLGAFGLIILYVVVIFEVKYDFKQAEQRQRKQQQEQQQKLTLADDILYRIWSQKHQDMKITRDDFDVLRNTGKLDKLLSIAVEKGSFDPP